MYKYFCLIYTYGRKPLLYVVNLLHVSCRALNLNHPATVLHKEWSCEARLDVPGAGGLTPLLLNMVFIDTQVKCMQILWQSALL